MPQWQLPGIPNRIGPRKRNALAGNYKHALGSVLAWGRQPALVDGYSTAKFTARKCTRNKTSFANCLALRYVSFACVGSVVVGSCLQLNFARCCAATVCCAQFAWIYCRHCIAVAKAASGHTYIPADLFVRYGRIGSLVCRVRIKEVVSAALDSRI